MTEAEEKLAPPIEMSDAEVYDLMVTAFTGGMIDPADRTPMLRCLGERELLFYYTLAPTEDAQGPDGDGITVRLSLEVQRRLKVQFAQWLALN